MTLAQRILAELEDLPETYQAEVLDFVEFLRKKSEQASTLEEDRTAWSSFSLAQALRGTEDEPGYNEDDLQEVF